MAEDSPIKFKPPNKQRRANNWNLCIICQEESKEKLRNPGEQGIKTFVTSVQERRNVGDSALHYRVYSNIDFGTGLFLRTFTKNVRWHKSCYSTLTSRKSLALLKKTSSVLYDESETDSEQGDSSTETRATRSATDLTIDWKKCIFCQQLSYKKEKRMIDVTTFEFGESLEKMIVEKGDNLFKAKLGDLKKLIANEAKYHKNCHDNYYASARKPVQKPSVHDTAFEKLLQVIENDLITEGRAFDMNSLLNIFKQKIAELDCKDISEDSYSTEKLKKKLIGHFGDAISFHKPPNILMPEIVFSSSIKMNDVINLASLYKDKIKQHKIAEEVSKNILDTRDLSQESTLYKAALIIRKELEDVQGIKYQPHNPSDISQETAENLIPDKLYTFISWLLMSSKQVESPEIISKNDIKEKNPTLHRYILSLGQDMLFMKSRGEIRTPKHVGLSITCHKMTQ